jgi:hypothetical protein
VKTAGLTDCSKYRVISLLSTTCTVLSNMFLSRTTQFVNEIIGGHQYVFRRNRLTSDQILNVHHLLEGKWEYIGKLRLQESL